jgi:hypothetical protein
MEIENEGEIKYIFYRMMSLYKKVKRFESAILPLL